MDFADLQLKIEGLNFTDIIKRETRKRLEWIESEVNYNHKDYRKTFLESQKLFSRKEDKIIFLVEALNYFNEQLTSINSDLGSLENNQLNQITSLYYMSSRDRDDSIEINKRNKNTYETQLFYAVRDLEKLGVKDLEKNAFSNEQTNDLIRKIDAILIKLNELSVGQEVIFDSVEELKTDFTELKSEFPLGKKRWYQRATGMVVNFAGEKGTEEIYNALRPLVKDFFNTHAPHLLENL